MLWQNEDEEKRPSIENSGADLPTTGGELFSAAWERNNLNGQQYSGEQDRFDALTDYFNTIKQKTGEDIGPTLDYSAASQGVLSSHDLLDQANKKLGELKQKNPALDLEPMTNDQLDEAGLDKRRKADREFGELLSRPRVPGATAGLVGGSLAAGFADPINLAALPVAPEEGLGILANALRWAAIGGGSEIVSQALQAPHREQVEPGYIESGAPLMSIAENAAVTGVLGGAFRGLADVWDRVRTGAWPQSVKQAGDIVTGEANIIASNVYPDADGAMAHPQALAKATEDILSRQPVDVSKQITPELEARAGQAPQGLAPAKEAAAESERAPPIAPAKPQAELPFEQTAAQGRAEAAKGALAGEVQQRAAGAGYDMPAEEAGRIADKLTKATPAEAQDIMRELQISPRQVADAPTRIEAPAEDVPTPVTPIDDPHAPEFQAAIRADLDRELLETAADYRAAGFTAEEAERLAGEHVDPYGLAKPAVGSREELAQMVQRGVPTEKLFEHPAVKQAVEEYKNLRPTGTPEDFKNPEWRAARVYDFNGEKVQGWDAAVSRLTEQAKGFAGGPVKNEGHATLVLGGPAAGKSTISEMLAKEHGAALVDSDEAKKVIPEYHGGKGTAASHGESTQLAADVFERLLPDKTNIVIPTVGSKVERIRAMMSELKDRGYKVDLVNVHVPVEVAQRRNIARFAETGRLVEPKYIADVGEKPTETTDILSREANDVAKVDTFKNTIEGTGPLADTIRARGHVGERVAGPAAETPRQAIPDGILTDASGKTQSLEKAMNELDGYKTAAEQIAACASPAAEQAEAA